MTVDTAAFDDQTHGWRLADGRTLGCGLYGASDGPLVLVLDGPGSRGLARAMASPAAQPGIKLLARLTAPGSAARPQFLNAPSLPYPMICSRSWTTWGLGASG